MIKVSTPNGPVWVNPAHVIWFWNYRGKLCIALVGRDDMLEVEDMTAEQFAALK
jgi:hypothetical protein